MEHIWKVGFIGMLVIAGIGLVMATMGGQVVEDVVDCAEGACTLPVEVEPEVVEEPEMCSGGCGKELGACGSSCGCGCQKPKDVCPGGCGLSACGSSCQRARGCGCGG